MVRPHHLAGQGSLGDLPPKARGAGQWVVLPGTFHDLLEASRSFRDRFGTFGTLMEHFHELLGPLTNVPELSK